MQPGSAPGDRALNLRLGGRRGRGAGAGGPGRIAGMGRNGRFSATLSSVMLCVAIAAVAALPTPAELQALAASRDVRNMTSRVNGTMLFSPPPKVTIKDQRKGGVCMLDAPRTGGAAAAGVAGAAMASGGGRGTGGKDGNRELGRAKVSLHPLQNRFGFVPKRLPALLSLFGLRILVRPGPFPPQS